MTDSGQTKVAIWARASTLDLAEYQLRALREEAFDEGYKVVYEYTVQSPAYRKPIGTLYQLYEDASRGDFDLLLLWSLDRLSKDLLTQNEVVATLGRNGVQVSEYMVTIIPLTDESILIPVKYLKKGDKPIRRAEFRKLGNEDLVDPATCQVRGEPVARINYFWKGCMAGSNLERDLEGFYHHHFVWENRDELLRTCLIPLFRAGSHLADSPFGDQNQQEKELDDTYTQVCLDLLDTCEELSLLD